MCPTVSKMGVRMQQVSSWCARWRILRCGDLTTILQLQNECTGLRNDTCVPNGGFTTAKHPAKWGFGYEIGSFYALWFRSRFAAAKWGYCAAKWHSCAKRTLRSCENFHREGPEAARWFCSKVAISQRLLLGCEISQTTIFPLFLHFFLLQTTFLQFLCNSSWFWSSKNLYYIKKKIELKHWNQN